MTPEQLDEIEKLAAAATPGPWVWYGPSSDAPADLWTADGKDAIVCVQTTNADVRFIQAMREHALPLVKALRETLSLKQQWAADTDAKEALLQSVAKVCRGVKAPDEDDLSVLGNVLRERDKARAEAVELRKKNSADMLALEKAMDASAEGSWMARALDSERELREARAERDKYKAALDAELPAAWREDIESLNSCLERIGKERDEAQAEVERLREVVRQVHALSGAMDKWPDVIDLKECGAKIHKITKDEP